MTMLEQMVNEGRDWRNGTFWLKRASNWVTEGQYTPAFLFNSNENASGKLCF